MHSEQERFSLHGHLAARAAETDRSQLPASNSYQYSHGYRGFSARVFPQPLSEFVVGMKHHTAHNIPVSSQAVSENRLYCMDCCYVGVKSQLSSVGTTKPQPAWTADLHPQFSLPSRSSSVLTSWSHLCIWTRPVLIHQCSDTKMYSSPSAKTSCYGEAALGSPLSYVPPRKISLLDGLVKPVHFELEMKGWSLSPSKLLRTSLPLLCFEMQGRRSLGEAALC